jgi:ATP-dependent protease ClpP protease subunit
MPKKFWSFRNSAYGTGAELLLYGDISNSTWWGDEVTPKQFADDLSALGAVSEITVRINSGGGDVFAAQAIGNLLEQHAATVTARIDGLCASAATIIACHCNKVIAANDSTYMVHPVKIGVFGYVDEIRLKEYTEALDAIRESILSLYIKKTGRTKEELAGWMDATSWWTSVEAKENGFVDELTDDGEENVVENRNGMLFINSVSMNLPFDKAPKFVQNSLAAARAAGSLSNKAAAGTPQNSEEEKSMEIKTVDDLRKAYPELVDQIEQAAERKSANEERQRIQDIEEMAMPGTEVMTAEAKFTKPLSASDYAKAAMKQIKNQGAEMLNSLQEDADGSGMNHVAHQHPQDSAEDAIMNAIKTAGKKA